MKTFRNVVLIIIGLFITILVINFTIFKTKYADYRYDIIHFQEYDYKHEILKKGLDFRKEYSVGNSRDTILIYTIDKAQRLIIFSLMDLENVNLQQTAFFQSDSLELMQLNPKQNFEYGSEGITFETKIDSDIWIDTVKVILHQNSSLDTSFRHQDNHSYKLNMSGLLIADSKLDTKFIIRTTKKNFDSELAFYKQGDRFYIIFTYDIKGENDYREISDLIVN